MIARNVDLDKTVPVADVLSILDELVTAMADREAALESNDWNPNVGRYRNATPAEVLAYAQDRVDEARLSLLAVIP